LAERATPPNDWMARADQERVQRDTAARQHMAVMCQQAAAQSAWRPQIDGANRAQRMLRGTRDR
jgi:hypothetical protein